jgi:hypothetical protein
LTLVPLYVYFLVMDDREDDADVALEGREEGQRSESGDDSGESVVIDTDRVASEPEVDQVHRALVEGLARNIARQDDRIERLSDNMAEYRVHVAQQVEHSFVEAASESAVHHEQVLAAMHAVAQRSDAMLATVREDQNTMNESGIELARRMLEMGQAVAHLVARSSSDAAGGTPAPAATPTAPSMPKEDEPDEATTPCSDWTKIMAGLGLDSSTGRVPRRKKDKNKERKPKDMKGKATAPVAGAGADPGDGSSSDHTNSSSEQGGGGRGGAGRRRATLLSTRAPRSGRQCSIGGRTRRP